jgi:hypothetical protein
MLGMNTLRAITGGKLSAKGPAEKTLETATDQEPVKTAEVHRIYPVAPAEDPRLVELLKLVEELRADREDLRRDRDAWRGLAIQARRGWWWSRRASTGQAQ